jgi:hypothetical protein
MIYTFNVRAQRGVGRDPIATVHHAHGVDVMGQARALMEQHPDCDGVEVMLLETRLFYLAKTDMAARSA